MASDWEQEGKHRQQTLPAAIQVGSGCRAMADVTVCPQVSEQMEAELCVACVDIW